MLFVVAAAFALTTTTDPADLCPLADAVVVAEATSAETEWAPGPRGDLRTRTWLAVSEVLRGSPGDTVELLAPGGTLQGLVQTVEDAARLQLDHRYVLLLTRTDEAWRVTGGAAGVFPLPHGVAAPTLAEVCRGR